MSAFPMSPACVVTEANPNPGKPEGLSKKVIADLESAKLARQDEREARAAEIHKGGARLPF